MSFSKIKFYGATVKSINSSLGWGNQKSSVTIQLVEDPTDGDFFLAPSPGTPSLFYLESFFFYGILQKWVRKQDLQGKPTFEVILEDPKDILDNCQLILDGYSGAVSSIPNLLNIYGYWESSGFGNSSINEGGMPWSKIYTAVTNITNGAAGTFGGPLIHKGGITYAVDLSELPSPPSYYRIGGGHTSLLEVISRVCDDGACDFFVELNAGTIPIIKIRTASRRLQPALGTISSLISSNTDSGICASSNNGLEATNNASSAFIVGGPKTTIYEAPADGIYPFWGIDSSGYPILGSGTDYEHTMTLNSLEISDIVGNTYTTTVLELLCALTDNNMWQNYITATNPTLSAILGLLPPIKLDAAFTPKFPRDAINTQTLETQNAGLANVSSVRDLLNQRVFSFIQKYASEFLGKKFIVLIPFAEKYTDPESGRITLNNEVTDAGYFGEFVSPLGLNPIYQTQFQTQDGRYNPYCVFSSASQIDFSRCMGQDLVIDTGGIYMHCNIDPKILYVNGSQPAVVVTISNAIYRAPIDATGIGISTIDSKIFGIGATKIRDLIKKRALGTLGMFISPLPYQPASIAIPMKSNTDSYGPWYAAGAPGRVQFTVDSSLVPWNYSGYTYMNLAANSKVAEAATYQQYAETGRLELAGVPTASLGDVLQAGGPNITNIEIGYGTTGVITTYSFATYTQKIGVFSKQNADRFRRIGHGVQDLRHEVKQNISRILQPGQQSTQGVAAEAYLYTRDGFYPHQARGHSPHSMLFGTTVGDKSGKKRSDCAMMTELEWLRGINANEDSLFSTGAGMSLSGLLRPFASDTDFHAAMSNLTATNEQWVDAINGTFYNPFKPRNDVEWYIYGNSYTDCKAYQNNGPEKGRFLALRGPLMISGWGWTTDNKPIPENEDVPGEFLTDYLRKSHLWPCGPVDLLWDKERGVWTSHDIRMGKITTDIGTGESGPMTIYLTHETATDKEITVKNFFSRSIPADTKVMVSWIADASEYYIVSADCN